jgi:WD40 repeat protein
MSNPTNTKLFISYAWRDDEPFVERLYDDLRRLGYDPWMDKTKMPRRGRPLPREVEEQLQVCDRVIAVMGPEATASEACQAERAFASSAGKVVTAILRLGDYKMLPPEISHYFVPDFRVSRPYEAALDELQRVLQDPPVMPGRLFDVPALPPHLLHRPDELRVLRESLTAAELKETAVITSAGHVGLHGMGGVGKTVMAALAATDYTVRRQFRDGIIWLTFGREPNILREVQKALTAVGYEGTKYDDVSLARMLLAQALEGKECLLILDDVWSAADAEPFVRAINPRCRLVITTRNLEVVSALGARAHPLDVLTVEQSRDLLARWSGSKPEELPPEAEDIMHECGRLPLALAMIGAVLRSKPPAFWKHVGNLLRRADLEKIKAQFPDYPHTDLLRAIQVSVDTLEAKARERYLALAVLLEDMPIHPIVQQTLWGADELDARGTAVQFVGLALAQRDGDTGSIRLHDLQLDYVRAQHADQQTLELVRGAVRLSSKVIEQDPGQFASQLVGRLLPHQGLPAVQQFTNSLIAAARRPWLRPLKSALDPPGTALVRTLLGHSREVLGVAMSADGRRAVSASNDQTLKVWDLESGRELRTLTGHSSAVNGVALSADGRRAVSVSGDLSFHDTALRVWDLESGRELRTLAGHDRPVLGVAVSADWRRAVSASWDGMPKVWDLESGRELRTLRAHSHWVTGVAVSADGRRAVSASWDKTLKVWDLESGRELHTLTGHSEAVFGVAMSADGRRAVSASWDKTLKVWDLETGRELRSLTGHSNGVNGVAVTPDGKQALSGSRDQTLKVWDLESGRELYTLAGHSDSVRGVAVSADARRAVSASNDQTVKVWDLEIGQGLATLAGHSACVNGVAVSADGRRVVSASKDKTLKVWDLESGRELRALAGHSDGVWGVAVSGDGRWVVSASEDQTLKVWDVESGRELRTLAGHSRSVHGVAVSGDGRRAVSASYDKTLKVWDLESGRELRTLVDHSGEVLGVAVSGDGRRAVSASWDRMLKVWDLESGHALRTLAGHSADVRSVALSEDGRRAVSASWDKTLKVWDLETGRELRTLSGHFKAVNGVAVNADGRRAVSASDDRTLKVWDLETGALLATFTCDAAAYCCAFAGARRIVAGDQSGRVHFLSLELKEDN